MLHPLAEKARAGRGFGAIQHPKQSSLLLLGAHGLGQLQIAAGAEIQSEILPLAVHRQFPDGGKVCLLRFRQIIQQGADGTYQRSVLQHLGLDRFAEALLYACGTVRGVKTPCLIIRKHDALAFQPVRRLGTAPGTDIEDNFARRVGAQLAQQFLVHPCPVNDRCKDLRSGQIGKAHTVFQFTDIQSAQIVIPLLRQKRTFNDGSGRHDPDDLPLDQSLRQRGVLHLLTDGNLIAFLNQFSDVHIGGMERNTAHGSALLLTAVAPGQGQFQFARGSDRIVKKHLIKVPQPVKQQVVLILVLDFHVLLHHGCHGLILLSLGISVRATWQVPVNGSRRSWSSRACNLQASLR